MPSPPIPTRGLFILMFLGTVIGGSLLLYALRAPSENDGAPFAAASRETLLLANNLLLSTACAMVLIGTLYPLLADALDLGKISVGPPYFALLFTLLMAPLVLLLPFGPLTKWQREQASRPFAMLVPWAGLAIGIGIASFFLAEQGPWKVAAGLAGATWVAAGTLRFLWTRFQSSGRKFTAEMLGMTFAHAGIAVFLVGVLLVEGIAQQTELALKPGQGLRSANDASASTASSICRAPTTSPTAAPCACSRMAGRRNDHAAPGKAPLRQRRPGDDRSRRFARDCSSATCMSHSANRSAATRGPCACTSNRSCAGSGSVRC